MVEGAARLGTTERLHCKLQSRPLIRDGALLNKARNYRAKKSTPTRKLLSGPPVGPMTTGLADRLTVGRELTSTSVGSFPREDELECLHLSPVSRKRRRKGNPMPGGAAVPPGSWGM
jgi:hypothetical protein